jgi:glycosyltransferase involved in cell wall biosynthesis
MKFSIITPSYNQQRFLKKTIDSVKNQKKKGFEIEHIIIDGKSNDGTIALLKKNSSYKWISEKDKGQSHALNKGIFRTNGDIIGWLNSDDIYYNNTLIKVASIFKKKKIDIIYGMADFIDEADKIIGTYKTLKFNFKILKKKCFISQPAVFFRRKLIYEHGLFDESLNYCIDYEYWLRLAVAKVDFYYFREKLAATRIHSNTKSSKYSYYFHKEIIKMLKNKFYFVSLNWIKSFVNEFIKKYFTYGKSI